MFRSDMELINPLAEQYAAGFTSAEDALLRQISTFTNQTHAHAHMLSGHVQGCFLTLLSQLLKPRRILEIGTFTGYSALCLAKGLTANGYLHTIEIREDDAATANGFFRQSPLGGKIIQHIGEARTVIPALGETWDLVFIDADKPGYVDYYELVLPSLRQNGIIIADNVLFHGQVLADNITGKNAVAINQFNTIVKSDPRVEQVMLTLRDGLLIIRKL
jgi:caffeoyl-CoA O-methyltransferase